MGAGIQFALQSWSLPVPVTSVLVLAALIYLRGWFRLRRTLPDGIPAGRAGAFIGGLFLVWIAVASPLASLDEELLSAHMVQHELLILVAAPLLVLGRPLAPFLWALPRDVREEAGRVSQTPWFAASWRQKVEVTVRSRNETVDAGADKDGDCHRGLLTCGRLMLKASLLFLIC